jgi:hypothetical protein
MKTVFPGGKCIKCHWEEDEEGKGEFTIEFDNINFISILARGAWCSGRGGGRKPGW